MITLADTDLVLSANDITSQEMRTWAYFGVDTVPEVTHELWYTDWDLTSQESVRDHCSKYCANGQTLVQATTMKSSGIIVATKGVYCTCLADTPSRLMAGLAKHWYEILEARGINWRVRYEDLDGGLQIKETPAVFIRKSDEFCLVRPAYRSMLTRVFIGDFTNYNFYSGFGPTSNRFVINKPGWEQNVIRCAKDPQQLLSFIIYEDAEEETRIPLNITSDMPLLHVGATTKWAVTLGNDYGLNDTHYPFKSQQYIEETTHTIGGSPIDVIDQVKPWYSFIISGIIEGILSVIQTIIQQITKSKRFWWSVVAAIMIRSWTRSDMLAVMVASIVLVV